MASKKMTTKAKSAREVVQTIATYEQTGLEKRHIFDYSRLKNPALIEKTESLEQLVGAGAEAAKRFQREISIVLYEIDSNKMYKRDGFKNIVEFSNSTKIINDERSKAAIYQYVFAGSVYSNTKFPESIRKMTVGNLAIMKSALSHDDTQKRIFEDAKIMKFHEMTQKEIRNYVESLKAPETVETYIVSTQYKTQFDESDRVAAESALQIEEYDNQNQPAKGDSFEFTPIKSIVFKHGEKASDTYTIYRRLYISADKVPTIYYFYPKTMVLKLSANTDKMAGFTAQEEIMVRATIDSGYTGLDENTLRRFIAKASAETIQAYARTLAGYPTMTDALKEDLRVRLAAMESKSN